VVNEIDRLLADHTYAEIAERLNARGLASGYGKAFTAERVKVTARAYGLQSRYTRLRQGGWLTLEEVAAKLGVCTATVKRRRAAGTLAVEAIRSNDMGEYLYKDPAGGHVKSGLVSTRTKEL
jgi:hypothetical protein